MNAFVKLVVEILYKIYLVPRSNNNFIIDIDPNYSVLVGQQNKDACILKTTANTKYFAIIIPIVVGLIVLVVFAAIFYSRYTI